jgi:hypothetical protein
MYPVTLEDGVIKNLPARVASRTVSARCPLGKRTNMTNVQRDLQLVRKSA